MPTLSNKVQIIEILYGHRIGAYTVDMNKVNKLAALIATQNTALLKELLEHAQMFYFIGDDETKYDAVNVDVINSKLAAMGGQ